MQGNEMELFDRYVQWLRDLVAQRILSAEDAEQDEAKVRAAMESHDPVFYQMVKTP